MNRRTFLTLLFCLSIFLSASSSFARSLHIFLALPTEFKGDQGQVKSLASELQNQAVGYQTVLHEYEVPAMEKLALIQAIQVEIKKSKDLSDRFLLLTVGSIGIDLIPQALKTPRLRTAYLAHQISDHFRKTVEPLKESSNLILILSQHIQNIPRRGHVIKTFGVLHSITSKGIQEAYAQNQKKFPANTPLLGVVLGGDAPQPDDKIKYFSIAEAVRIADYIGKKATEKNAAILILNGPRTGKYDPATGKINPNAHRGNETDLVTLSFMSRLKAKFPKIQSLLFDFQYDQPSLYQAVLGALAEQKGDIYVPGESTSMISETIDVLPNHVYVYRNQAMNPTHEAHIQSEFDSCRIHLLTQDLIEMAYTHVREVPSEPQKVRVSRELLKQLK